MDAALAAYLNLCTLARADGEVCEAERGVLARYQRSLGIKARMLRQPIDRDLVAHDAITGSPQECAHVMKMMARVAFADGELSRREERRLTEVAASLGIGKLQFADILVAVEAEAIHKRRLHRWLWTGGSTLVVGIGLVLIVSLAMRPSPEQQEAERRRVDALEARIDQLPVEEARQAAREIRASWSQLLQRERALARRVAELEAGKTTRAKELATLRIQLGRVTNARTGGFKAVEKAFRASVLLVVTRYELVRGSTRRRGFSTGTGFFVSPDGLIATSKHVLQPWKFVPEIVQRLDAGFRVDPRRTEIMAWPSGSRVLQRNGRWDFDSCFYNQARSLAIIAMPADTMQVSIRRLKNGDRHRGRYHASDNHDLAILQAKVERPVKPLPLLVATKDVEKLDPVMVLGFPTGIRILEDRRAETSPSVGVVRKAENTILIDAPIVGGNSGGPAVDAKGRVIGVATRTYGDASLGCCIRAANVLRLLPGARHFIDAAKKLAPGDRAAALQSLELATLRQPTPDQTRTIARLQVAWQGDR